MRLLATWRLWGADIEPALGEFCAGLLGVIALPVAGDDEVLVDDVFVVFVDEDVDGALLFDASVEAVRVFAKSGDDCDDGEVLKFRDFSFHDSLRSDLLLLLLCDDAKSTKIKQFC